MHPRAGLCALLFLAVTACSEPVPDPLRFDRANVMIISIDTLRADRLGSYGNTRGLTPVLDEFAEDAVLFEDVFSNSPKTASSHMSLFTSMYPTAHGVTNFSPRQEVPLIELADNRKLFAEVLQDAGYWNFGVACGGNLNPAMGFSRGFGLDGRRFMSANRPLFPIVTATLDAADAARRQSKPYFLFMHTYQVHGPYVPAPEFKEKFAPTPRGLVGKLMRDFDGLKFNDQWRLMHEGLWDHKDKFGPEDARYLSELYDAEVAQTDNQLRRLFDGLKSKNMYDDMLIVVLSDHGEEFAEHGDYEHDQLFREHLHVPLLVKLPRGILGGTRVKGLCSLVDVMPTLFELMGVEGPREQMMGTSLVSTMTSGRTEGAPLFAERVMYADDLQFALRTGSANVIFHAAPGELEAYDLVADPAEQEDVAWEAPFFADFSSRLQQTLTNVFALRHSLDEVSAGRQATLTEEALEELKQLGYVDTDVSTDEAGITLPEGTPLDAWPSSRDG